MLPILLHFSGGLTTFTVSQIIIAQDVKEQYQSIPLGAIFE